MILVNDPFDQSCRAQISSTCFICSRVTIQKSVFRILHSYSIFLATSFRVSNAQYAEILNYWSLDLYSVLSGFSLSQVLWSIFGELVCMQHISNSTAEGQHHAMQGLILYYGFQHYRFLWISSASVRSLIEVLSIISPSQLTLCYSEWVNLLKFWQCTFISDIRSVLLRHRQRMYIYGRRAEMSQS